MRTSKSSNYVSLISDRKNRVKDQGKIKDRIVMLIGAVLVFIITFVIYGIMEDPDSNRNNGMIRTGNQDIIAQIDRLEEQKRIREEKELKLKDDVFLGRNTPVDSYAESLINDLKSMSVRNEQKYYDPGLESIPEKSWIAMSENDYFPEEIFSELLREKNSGERTVKTYSDLPKPSGIQNKKDKVKRVSSLFAFSNRIRSARIFNNGFENIINEFPGSGGKISGTDKHSSQSTFRLIYNSNPIFKVFEGDFIEAVLTNKIINNRDASPVTATVSRDLLDKNGMYVLIPSGSRFVGEARRISSQQDRRLMIRFHRLILPNGRAVQLGRGDKRFSALDNEGSLGLKGKKNGHVLARFGSSLLFGSLNGLSGFAQSKIDRSSGLSQFLNRTSNNFEMLNERLASESLSVMPTITVKSGTEIKIYVSDDIEISAYSKISERSYYGR